MIRRLLARWANAAFVAAAERLETRVAELEAQVEAQKRLVTVLEVERDTLAAVCARDLQRVKSETAALARQQAEAEGERSSESTRRFSA